MQDDFGVALNALVELLVGLRGLFEWDLMRDDKARLGAARDDEVAKLAVVALDIALPGAHPQALLEHLADGDEQESLLGLSIRRAGIGGNVETGNTQHAGGADRVNQSVEHGSRLFVLGALHHGLIAYGVNALVGAFAVGLILDLLDRIALIEVDRDSANLLRLVEPLLNAVNDEDP